MCDYCKLNVSAPVEVLLETNSQLAMFNTSHLLVSSVAKTEYPQLHVLPSAFFGKNCRTYLKQGIKKNHGENLENCAPVHMEI